MYFSWQVDILKQKVLVLNDDLNCEVCGGGVAFIDRLDGGAELGP